MHNDRVVHTELGMVICVDVARHTANAMMATTSLLL